ncbi:MAG: PilZ domain-containing protein [Pseudomonadota bacterium]
MNALRKRLMSGQEGRAFPRVSGLPVFVTVDGETYRARDWSIGGIGLRDYPAEVKVGDHISGELRPSDNRACGVKFVGEVAWTDGDGSVGLRLLFVPVGDAANQPGSQD